MDSAFSDDLAILRQNWSKQLRLSLKYAYGGRMPSLSTVSRDLALRSPYLSQVSNETVRKWIRGDSIPSAVAILALANWLGKEILLPLSTVEGELSDHHAPTASFPDGSGAQAGARAPDKLIAAFKRLSPKDQSLVLSLAEALNTQRDRL